MKRFNDYEHVLRVAMLLAAGLVVFAIIRQAYIPVDFGTLGFYRTGALAANQARPIQYGGQTACLDCHSALEGSPKENRHAAIRCETCHGPLAKHVADAENNKPRVLNPRLLCLSCHSKGAGKPDWFPQIVPAKHEPNRVCGDCHQPHRPKAEAAIKANPSIK